MTRRSVGPGATALLVVLCVLGLGTAGLAAVVALAGAEAPWAPGPTSTTSTTSTTSATGRGDAEQRGQGGSDDQEAVTSVAREVLRAWDRRREQAWAATDEAALAALYVPGAPAGRRDVALLRRWTARGARVVRLQPQLLELTVLRETRRRLVVRVTDRVAILEVRVAGEPVTLPQDRATTRRIELRRGPRATSRWRVVSVSGDVALATPASLEG